MLKKKYFFYVINIRLQQKQKSLKLHRKKRRKKTRVFFCSDNSQQASVALIHFNFTTRVTVSQFYQLVLSNINGSIITIKRMILIHLIHKFFSQWAYHISRLSLILISFQTEIHPNQSI